MKKFLLNTSLLAYSILPNIVRADDIFGSDYAEMNRAVNDNVTINNATYEHVNTIFGFCMGVLQLLYIVALCLGVVGLVYSIIRYGISGANPKIHEESKKNIFTCLITLGILGSISIIFSIIVNVLNLI